MRVLVECYAGYKGAERPVRFCLGERWLEVVEVVRQWCEPDGSYFEVLGGDGKQYVLRHTPGMDEDSWTLQSGR